MNDKINFIVIKRAGGVARVDINMDCTVRNFKDVYSDIQHQCPELNPFGKECYDFYINGDAMHNIHKMPDPDVLIGRYSTNPFICAQLVDIIKDYPTVMAASIQGHDFDEKCKSGVIFLYLDNEQLDAEDSDLIKLIKSVEELYNPQGLTPTDYTNAVVTVLNKKFFRGQSTIKRGVDF